MVDLWVKRVGVALLPDGDESIAVFSKIPFNKSLHAEVKQPRNGAHHRLLWAVVHRVAEGVGAEPENVMDLIKVATGHCVSVKTKTRGTLQFPKSISFAAMDQTAFREFFDKALIVIFQEWGIDKDAFSDLIQDKVEAAE
jgi:hypothetical protein